MKKILTLSLSLMLLITIGVAAQSNSSSSATQSGAKTAAKKRGPVFRATREQIIQAQEILKGRGFLTGEQSGKLDTPTRDGLKKYQNAENLKVTGTLNRLTLEKMGISLTDKQKTM
jgi:putative peptidoglycan binding protein